MLKISLVGLLLLVPQVEAAELTGIASVFSDRVVACPPYRINPYKLLGAAHRTLPCGTVVEVTNKANGRVANATIMDVGPCSTAHCRNTAPRRVKQRMFDMLPRLAKLLGSSGLTRVSLRVVR